MSQTLRQQARRQVNEATATRKRVWAEREARLVDAAVEVVAAIVARDRAEQAAAQAILAMADERVSLTEIGERCALPLKEVARLKKLQVVAGAGSADSHPISSEHSEQESRA